MLRLLGKSQRTCDGVTRREFLEAGRLALGGLSLAGLISARAQAAAAGQTVKDTSVILLFLTGGPSQIETFDPKMTAPAESRSVTGEVATSLAGVTLGGTFTHLARHVDKLALVRSFSHDSSDHTKAVELVARGGNPIHQAGMGAFAARLRSSTRAATGLPPHIYLGATEVDRQFDKERQRLFDATGPGSLGGAHGPLAVGGDGQLERDMRLAISPGRLGDRLALHREFDRLHRQFDARRGMQDLNQFEEQAVGLLLGRSRQAFDLADEDPRLVARYDTSRFQTGITRDRPSTLGKQLLLARRLCEAGCGFVTIHNPGWDMHGGETQMNMPVGMERLGRPLDHAVSAFLEDVTERGLSERILLVITGEFGRTPLVRENGGRDHWPRLSTLALAGGGLRMGQVVGRSTSKAEEPQSEPVTLDQLFATIMHVLFDLPALTARADLPRDISSVLSRSRPIAELV